MRPIIKQPTKTITRRTSASSVVHQLIEAVGAYCMYCEAPVADDAASDGRVSMSREPIDIVVGQTRFIYSAGVEPTAFAREWVNAELACEACRRAKADQLGGQAAFSRLAQINQDAFNRITGGAKHKERLTHRMSEDDQDDLYLAALSAWVWPDLATDGKGVPVTAGDDTWGVFAHVYDARSQLSLAADGLVRLSEPERELSWAQERRTQAWVVPDGRLEERARGNDEAADLLARVKATIAGLNLNYANPLDPRAADRRVVNRTAAYEAAGVAIEQLTAAAARLRTAVSAPPIPDADLEHRDFERLAEFVRSALRSTGFWTTWAKRLAEVLLGPAGGPWAAYSPEARRRVLYKLVVQYEYDARRPPPRPPDERDDDSIIPRLVLAGTDADRLPF